VSPGLGEWHLQPVAPESRQYRAFLLRGPLGPEALKLTHGLEAAQMLALYGTLQRHSGGFVESVQRQTAAARERPALLEAVFAGFALLLKEALEARPRPRPRPRARLPPRG